jgi:hypothetical protein
VELFGLASRTAAHHNVREVPIAPKFDHLGVEPDVNLRVGEHLLPGDLAGCQLGAAREDRDLAGEAGQEDGLFDGAVTAADHQDRLIPVERPVAGGAEVDARADEIFLARRAETTVGGAGRHQHSVRPDLPAIGEADDAVLAVGLNRHHLGGR